MIRQELRDYLASLEKDIKPLDEFSVEKEIDKLLNKKGKTKLDEEEIAESIAYKFMPNYNGVDLDWGTYHGPRFIGTSGDGQRVESPSIKLLNEKIIGYWAARAINTKHPQLANLFTNLVLDFEPVVLKKKFNYSLAQTVIDTAIEICEKNLDDALGCRVKLERALSLALQINDAVRIEKLKHTIVETENKFAEDNKPGLWGYSFKWLILENPSIPLTDIEKDNLIRSLEDRLNRLSSESKPDPWSIECAVQPLAEYYSKINDEGKLKSTINKLESAFRKSSHSNSDGLLTINYLEKLSEFYVHYSQFEFAKQANQRIVAEISSLGDRGKFAMQEIKVDIPIRNEDIEKFKESIFGENGDVELSLALAKICVNLVPRKDAVEKQFKDISQKHPVQYLFTHVLISEDNYPIAKIGSLSEDYDQHLLQHFGKNLHFQSVFLRIVFDELRIKYTPLQIYDCLALSPVFRDEDKGYIIKMLEAFKNKEFLTVSSLSIPLIEDAVRNIYKLNKLSYIKLNDTGGFDVQDLNRLLDGGVVKGVFQRLGESMEYYFKVLLTARAGWNLRNNFAHGINKSAFMSEDVANRLLHVLICLSLIRKNDKEEDANI